MNLKKMIIKCIEVETYRLYFSSQSRYVTYPLNDPLGCTWALSSLLTLDGWHLQRLYVNKYLFI